jgi:alkanesulfonate monooxygenase SsuD/methylene tetrahydromethanopterin reductase-like flavin-dependent oxidoreductase (luciferase family)
MDRIAVAFSPLRDAPPEDILAWSRRAEALGFAAVFVPESFNDSLAYAQAVASATTRLHVGTAITNIYLRHPSLLAQQAAAVQEFSGGRLLLGLGVGHRPVNASLGIDMGDPLAKTRDVIPALRAAWAKGPHQPRPRTPPRILAAALVKPMIELAGELADGVIFNLFPLERYRRAMAMLHRGATRGGRDPQALESVTSRPPTSATTVRPACTRPSGCWRATPRCRSTATCWRSVALRRRSRRCAAT